MSSYSLKQTRVGGLLALLLAAVFAFAVTAPAANADDVVTNPGPFTATFTGGQLTLGGLDPVDVGASDPPATVSGTIAADGSINVPAANLVFPPLVIEDVTLVGDVTINITAPNDITGSLDPTTGVASLNVSLLASVPQFGSSCKVGPIAIPMTSGTTSFPGTPPEGWAPVDGTPYDSGTGLTTLVNNTFGINAISNSACKYLGFISVGNTLNDQVGLPAPAGSNNAAIQFSFDPAPQGPAVGPNFDVEASSSVATFGSQADVPATGNASFIGDWDTNTNDVSIPADSTSLPSFEGDFGSISFSPNGAALAGTSTPNGKVTIQGPVKVDMTLAGDDGDLTCHATTRLQLRTDQRALYNGARFTDGLGGAGALAAHWDSIPNVRGDAGCATAAADVAGPGGMLLSSGS